MRHPERSEGSCARPFAALRVTMLRSWPMTPTTTVAVSSVHPYTAAVFLES